MQDLFLVESTKNKNLPIGGGMWSTAMFHLEDAPSSGLAEWTFYGPMTRMPESAAPKLGKVNSLVAMDVEARRTPTACSMPWPDFPAAFVT